MWWRRQQPVTADDRTETGLVVDQMTAHSVSHRKHVAGVLVEDGPCLPHLSGTCGASDDVAGGSFHGTCRT